MVKIKVTADLNRDGVLTFWVDRRSCAARRTPHKDWGATEWSEEFDGHCPEVRKNGFNLSQ